MFFLKVGFVTIPRTRKGRDLPIPPTFPFSFHPWVFSTPGISIPVIPWGEMFL